MTKARRSGRSGAKKRLPIASANPYTPDLLHAIAEGERKVVAQLLQRPRTAATAVGIAEMASARAAELSRAALARHPPASVIACREGCSFCCSSKVLALAPEVLRIAEHLRAVLSPAAFDDLRARTVAADVRTRGLTRRERGRERLACPLLVEGRCSIHPLRPLVCAAWTSLDVAACEHHERDPSAQSVPVYPPQYEIGNAVMGGVARGAMDAGLEGRPLELIAALRIALERPNAAERWLRGLPVFSQAVDAETAEGSG